MAATGMQTEFGKIAQMLQSIEVGRTPLQQNASTKWACCWRETALVVVAIIVVLGLRGQPACGK